MSLTQEIRGQRAYLARLSEQLGPRAAVKARLLTFLGKRFGLDGTFRMHPSCVQHPVHLRTGTTDAATYLQVLVQQQYLAVGDLEPEVIVDCGANAGFTSAWMLSRWPKARVIALEPFSGSAAIARRNLAPYGGRAELREAAVWSHAGRLVMEAVPGNEWGVQVREARPGEAGDVDALGIADLALPRIDLLKIDIEGSETELFSAHTETWLPSVGAIAIELHGPHHRAVFEAALAGYDYAVRDEGELTIVTGLRRR